MSKLQPQRYEQELGRLVAERYGNLSATEMVATLSRIGVIDHSLCKILAVRSWVEERFRLGAGKVEAMWLATSHFAVSYDFVRRAVYYYKDVNI